MTIVDDDVLADFRSSGQCELCGRRVYPLDPHHAFLKRGMGGGSRLDVPENLAALCRICHHECETQTAVADTVRRIVAKRHGLTTAVIREWLDLVNRTPKERAMPRRPWGDSAA